MDEKEKTAHRLVSKGEYAAVQVSRTTLGVSAVVSVIEVLICVFMAFRSFSFHLGGFGAILALTFGLLAYRFGLGGLRKLRQARRLEKVLPLTRRT